MTDELKVHNQSDSLRSIFKLQSIFESAAKKNHVVLNNLSELSTINGTLSTGVLFLDLLMGGGCLPGRFTYFYGPTGSCKSTALYSIVTQAMSQQIDTFFEDFEGSTDPSYLRKLGMDLEKSNGVRSKSGWKEDPLFRYLVPTTAEAGFGLMHSILKDMPDKIMMEYDGEVRYFQVSPGYDYQATWKSINQGLKDKKIIEVEDGKPQAIFMVDSLKMLTEARDEDSSKDMIAALARALHNCFSLVKPALARKMVNLVCTNHLTINPMAKFGNPESEPGGKAVEFFPDVKIKLMVNRAQSKVITEPHVSGDGYDRYLMGTATIVKNKGGPSMRKMDYRVWIDEQGEPGRGFCPVYDLFQFMLSTNQMVALKEDSFKITFTGVDQPAMKFGEFKKWVLTTDEGKEVMAVSKQQMKDGVAQKLYYENMKSGALDKAAKDKAKKLAMANKIDLDLDEDEEKIAGLSSGENEVEL